MFRILVALCLVVLPAAPDVAAAPLQDDDADNVLVVGTKDAPPFSMPTSDGRWVGLSISLWERAAAEAGLQWRYVERDLDGLIDGLRDNTLDASIAALTMTAQREDDIDFTHPYHTSGLGIAVARGQGSSAMSMLRAFPYMALVKALGVLVLVLFLAGLVLWLFERPRNREQFRPGVAGLGDAFWWSAVTLTTVGYGDKSPRTTGGRTVAIVWMFLGVFIISAFTASIASLMTAERLSSRVGGPDDLPEVRVATVQSSTSEAFLETIQVDQVAFPSVEDALDALVAGQFDAVVYDAPILRHLVKTRHRGRLEVLPHRFRYQRYAIGLPQGSPLREPLNRAILHVLNSAVWDEALKAYLGD